MLGTFDTLIIVCYFLFTLLLGIFLRKKAARGLENYFLGGRTVPWWVLGASGTASNFDMTGTMIMVSFIFAIGLQGFWVAMRGGMCLPLGLLMVYMAKWLRRSNVMTTAEWMEFRFGSGTQGQAARLLSAVANLIVTLAFLTYFVEGTGKFLSVFLGWSPELCALILIVIAVAYTTLSGLYGVIFTDLGAADDYRGHLRRRKSVSFAQSDRYYRSCRESLGQLHPHVDGPTDDVALLIRHLSLLRINRDFLDCPGTL